MNHLVNSNLHLSLNTKYSSQSNQFQKYRESPFPTFSVPTDSQPTDFYLVSFPSSHGTIFTSYGFLKMTLLTVCFSFIFHFNNFCLRCSRACAWNLSLSQLPAERESVGLSAQLALRKTQF